LQALASAIKHLQALAFSIYYCKPPPKKNRGWVFTIVDVTLIITRGGFTMERDFFTTGTIEEKESTGALHVSPETVPHVSSPRFGYDTLRASRVADAVSFLKKISTRTIIIILYVVDLFLIYYFLNIIVNNIIINYY
jgi:hypothetical protein